jgi:hypothetical protein
MTKPKNINLIGLRFVVQISFVARRSSFSRPICWNIYIGLIQICD